MLCAVSKCALHFWVSHAVVCSSHMETLPCWYLYSFSSQSPTTVHYRSDESDSSLSEVHRYSLSLFHPSGLLLMFLMPLLRLLSNLIFAACSFLIPPAIHVCCVPFHLFLFCKKLKYLFYFVQHVLFVF